MAAGLAMVAAGELAGDDVELPFEVAFVIRGGDVSRVGQEPEHITQMLGDLAMTDLRLALLLNFKHAKLQWKRIIP